VFTEQAGTLVSLLVWLGFGAVAVPIVTDLANWTIVLYAVLSLTVVRMVPVALASAGSGLDRNAVLFIGWFGPRGLASLLFALLALEELGQVANQAVAVIAVTVILSVIAHGVTAAPLAARYGRAVVRAQEHDQPMDLPVPRRPRRLKADPTHGASPPPG
jgi:NhaP-type Na+/H+ or K+/H+ antiporter